MPVSCPKCGQLHDVAGFESDKELTCRCGQRINIYDLQTAEDLLRFLASEEERARAEEIRADAQQICRMILDEGTAEVDIEIARSELQKKVRKYFPDKLKAFEMIYEARFNRLWEQFRLPGQGHD